jgi:RimJ/RimL family protein N-acetyltransferase
VLRPFTVADAAALYDMQAEPHVERFFGVTTRAEIDEWLAGQEALWAAGGYGRLVITDRVTGELLGRSGLKYWDEYDEVEVGWMLRAAYLGRGYATEAGKACLDWGFAHLDVDHITAMIRPENTGSIAVAERLGMSLLREDVLHDAPTLVFAIWRPHS